MRFEHTGFFRQQSRVNARRLRRLTAKQRCRWFRINLVAFSVHLHDLTGQVFSMFILTVAAAEAAIGLAILVVFFRNKASIAVEDISALKG